MASLRACVTSHIYRHIHPQAPLTPLHHPGKFQMEDPTITVCSSLRAQSSSRCQGMKVVIPVRP